MYEQPGYWGLLSSAQLAHLCRQVNQTLLTVSGRERVNLNAAVNAYQPMQVLLDETPRVQAQSTRRLYEQLLAAHPTTATIYVICDNACSTKTRH
ncbi:hypothetical protein [Hymenobacter amundsenii]|uniref:hypothetical protein n=1 Tax=Hymenobacter amundsenii TaxID=2006685 RepID=UPI000F828725|nr:hypothetical protein [Hymenobacter amundsenii]